MKWSNPALAAGLVVEKVGDQTLALVGNPPRVVRLSPEAAAMVSLIQQNPGLKVEQTPALSELVDLGVVEGTPRSTLSRRGVLKLSAVAGAAGLSTVLLPSAAMAASSEPSPFDITGSWSSLSGGNYSFSVPGGFPKVTADKLTLEGIDDFGIFFGSRWGSTDTRFAPLVGQTLTGTFLDSSTGDVYTVTFLFQPV